MASSGSNFVRKIGACVVFAAVLAGGGPSAFAQIELPAWEEEEGKPEEFQLGAGLWPSGVLDIAAAKDDAKEKSEKEKAADALKPTETSDSKTPAVAPDVKLANTETGEVPAENSTPVEPTANDPVAEPKAIRRPVVEIPPNEIEPGIPERIFAEETLPPLIEEMELMPPIEGPLRDRFFKSRPHEFLVDPQQLLTEQKSNDVRRFLEYHAEEAGIDIYMIVMGKGQTVPSDISLEEKHSEWFGEIPTALVATTMGTLGKTQIIYGQDIKKTVDDEALEKVYQHCVREANKIENPSDQIEQIALELSIQLYWISQIVEKGGANVPAISALSNQSGANAEPDHTAEPIPFHQPNEPVAEFAVFGLPMLWVAGGAVGLLALIGLWALVAFLRRDSLDRKPVLFEELSIPGRLGGEYSGGGFVGISYDLSGQK